MIGEHQFIGGFSSFWRNATPTCDLFLRALNQSLYEIVLPPIVSSTAPARRALINEIAFNVFRGLGPAATIPGDTAINETVLQESLARARKTLSTLERGAHEGPLVAEEVADIALQVRNLKLMIGAGANPATLIFEPQLPGCGFLSQCTADILKDRCLIEVKAGDRKFRSIDIRQLVTYAALNYAAKKYDIMHLCLVNPRQGTRFVSSLEHVCYEISGQSSTELLSAIVYAISSGDISR